MADAAASTTTTATSGGAVAPVTTTASTPPAEGVSGATGASAGAEGSTGATGAAESATGPKGDQESALYRAARQKEAKLVAREQRFATERAQFASERAQADARDKATAAREAAMAERERLLDEDPLAYATKHKGYRDEDLARRFLGNGKPSPQEEQARAEAKHQAELKELRDRIDAREKAENEQKQAADRTAYETRIRSEFSAFTESKASTFPRAHAMLKADADETISQVDAIAARLIARGDARRGQPLWEAALGHYDSHLSKLSGTVATSSGKPGTQGSEKPGQPGHEAADETAPTLSGKGAAKRSTVPKTDDPLALELTDPQAAKAAVVEEIRKAKKARSTAA
jgi:hypothetical protein